MLDQNTDRMWYVIGALVVGAGIILLANKAMPEIFASVADTFSEKTDDVTAITEGIMPVSKENNLILQENVRPASYVYTEMDREIYGFGVPGNVMGYIPIHWTVEFTPVVENTAYTFSGHRGLYNPRIAFYNDDKEYIDSVAASDTMDNKDGTFGRNIRKMSVTTPAGTAYVQFSAEGAVGNSRSTPVSEWMFRKGWN